MNLKAYTANLVNINLITAPTPTAAAAPNAFIKAPVAVPPSAPHVK